MENLKEKFELSDEALEQVAGGTDSVNPGSYYFCARCKKYIRKDATDEIDTTSGVPKHSCGNILVEEGHSTRKISPQNN